MKKKKIIQASPKLNKETPRRKRFIEQNAFKIVVLIGIVGLILRVYRLGYFSLWVDEYMHALAAINGKFSHGENNGILLTWLNTGLSYIIGHSEFALRLPVAIIGAFLVPSIFLFGKAISNYKVGLMAAIFATFSLYLVFWSRVDRPYGMVPTFYVLACLFTWLALETKSIKQNFWSKIGLNPRYFLFAMAAFILCMLSQLICFVFVFSVGFYGSFVTIDNWIRKKTSPLKWDIFNILFLINILTVFFMFTPIGSKMLRPVLELFLPASIATFILPDIKNIVEILNGNQWDKCYNTYMDVINTDFKWISILGWGGFIFAFFKSRKLGYFLFSLFVIPFLLLSFIFTSTSHAKYLIQLYPIFLISASFCLYFIAFYVLKFVNKKSFIESNTSYSNFMTFGFLVLFLGILPKEELKNMLKSETYGNLVSSKLSEISYVNWRQPCLYLKSNMKKNDVVMATVQFAPRYYLEMDAVVWFRQMHLNPKWSLNSKTEEKYISNLPDNKKLSANSYDALVRTYNENQRGWLLADYYFDNALTDQRAKQFVEQNFTYHFEASNDGGVKVFSWDKSNPKQYQSSFVIEMGKNENQLASSPMSININKASLPVKLYMYFTTQGIDSNDEAFVLINDAHQVAIKTNGQASKVGINMVEVDPNFFIDGENKIQFAYNGEEGNGDLIKGCAIYSMDLR